MKVHVMVATTQGLVAIQKIYAQDPDIRSVVSINGTSTVSPISAAYHHFVKKGVGIIEADFGASSYRVNIDAAIDQGNSWQLAFYLAHAVHAQNLLGNGKPQAGDWVICATGELNTSEKTVLAVEQTALKIERAASQIALWPKDVTLRFVLPQANFVSEQSTQSPQLSPQQFVYVEYLQQALDLLPLTKTCTTSALITKDLTTVSTNNLDTKSFALSKRFALITALVLSVLILVLAYFFADNTSKIEQGDNGQDAGLATQPLTESATNKATAFDKIIALSGLNTTNASATTNYLRLGYSPTQNCKNNNLNYQELGAIAGTFASANFANLCDIRLVTTQNFAAVLAINIHSHRFVQASQQHNEFVIPVPGKSANYLLLAFNKALTASDIRQIHGYLFNLSDNVILSEADLKQLPVLAERGYTVFKHQLID